MRRAKASRWPGVMRRYSARVSGLSMTLIVAGGLGILSGTGPSGPRIFGSVAMRGFVRRFVWLIATTAAWPVPAADRPNILWIVVDDMSADFGCYGSTAALTPHVDRLAAEGTRFTRAFVTAPVCSPCRSALITGMYQTTIGAHHHRSGRGTVKIELPVGVRPVPAIFREAGWYTCIGDGLAVEPQHGRLHLQLAPELVEAEVRVPLRELAHGVHQRVLHPLHFLQVLGKQILPGREFFRRLREGQDLGGGGRVVQLLQA